MDTVSLWKSIPHDSATYPSITQNIEVDVAIVGGGITGVTTALHLINAGKKVAIIEANSIGSGTTGSSTGNLYVAVQPYFQNILAKFNEETVKAIALSRKLAIDFIENTVHSKNLDCNFSRRPWYLYTEHSEKVAFLDREIEVIKKTGLPIEYTSDLPLPFKFKKAAVMHDQARVNPLQYVTALTADLHKKGCLVFENSRVTAMEEKDGCIFHTAGGKVTAKQGVIATHTPMGVNPIQLFTAPYRSYVLGVHLKDNFYPEGHYWSLDDPYYSTCTHPVLTNQPELLLVAGSHHKTGQDNDTSRHFGKLEAFLENSFAVSDIAYQWSAQHYQSADDVPFIGLAYRGAKHTFLATGFFADGLVYGVLASMVIGKEILGHENNWGEVYRPSRFKPFASAAFVLKENLNVFVQYLKDYPMRAKNDYKNIKAGEASIVEIEGEKYGAYRDDKEELHIVSAVCTHMKCIVNWNNAEKTWDCPCHGSRFTVQGKVIEGPAQHDLAKWDKT